VDGWVKFQSLEWENGTLLHYVLIHPEYSRWNGWLLMDSALINHLLALLVWFIRDWEVLFPLLLLNRYTRRVSIVIGILFHIGLLLTLHLRWFPVVMLALYPALLSNKVFITLEKKWLKTHK